MRQGEEARRAVHGAVGVGMTGAEEEHPRTCTALLELREVQAAIGRLRS
jgi:hypothetical protein